MRSLREQLSSKQQLLQLGQENLSLKSNFGNFPLKRLVYRVSSSLYQISVFLQENSRFVVNGCLLKINLID